MQTATRIYLDFLYNIFSSLFLYTLVRQNVKILKESIIVRAVKKEQFYKI